MTVYEKGYLKELLPNELIGIIDIMSTPWGEYKIYVDKNGNKTFFGINNLELGYLKEDLKSIIKETIPDFDEKITPNDVYVYNKVSKKLGLNNALEESARLGSLNLVKYFIKKGANVFKNAVDYASSEGHLNVVKYIVEKLKDETIIPISNMKGKQVVSFWPDMTVPAEKGYLDIVKYLVEEDVIDDYQFYESLKAAKRKNQQKVVDYLESL